ncbi:MAG: phenylacetic acid degradation protein [Pseudohongiellaceae bacterium]|jgi:phenylacetic acid degradation protein
MTFYAIDGVTPYLDLESYVHPTAVIIGDVIISKKCYIGPNAVLRGDFGQIYVDEGSNIQDCCVIHSFPGRQTILGRNSHIGHSSIIHGCTLEENCLVGINCTVLDNAHIGANCIIGANSLVPDSFESPSNKLVFGSPAKIKRDLKPEELKWKENGTLEYQNLAIRSHDTLIECRPERISKPDGVRLTNVSHKTKKEFI